MSTNKSNTINGETLTEFRGVLRALEREIGSRLKSETSCCGVTTAQCHVLLELDLAGEMTISDLAESFVLDKSTLSRTVDGLVKNGEVFRREDPLDRRHTLVGLTEKGKLTAEDINRTCNESYRSLFSYLPEEEHGRVLQSVKLLVEGMIKFRKENSGDGPSCVRKGSKRRDL